ncbi:MAG: glutathione S-transferase family protein [Alphaproteobacteria bacterium]|nr:glutathione S-transferase family protein [Alphaproteobacteria bacterium]
MLTLYGNLESGNVYKVRLLLSWLGLPHRRVEVNQVRGEPMSPAFRAINPIGKVPALRLGDGRVLTESGSILYFLAQGTAWWPADRWDQAGVLRWMFFEQYSHEPAIAVNRYLLRFAGELSSFDAERIRFNDARGRHALQVMEDHLAGAEWLVGSGPTIADIALYAYTHVADEGGFELAAYPAVGRWLARVAALPGHVGLLDETSARPVERLVAG